MAANTTSTVSRTASRKRRVMSSSSGFLPSSSVGVRGSSAMPQIGQLPGTVAHDLGVHGAGPHRARGRRRLCRRAVAAVRGVSAVRCVGAGRGSRGRGRRGEIARGVRAELVAAPRAAEAVGLALVLVGDRALGRDRHPAHRIDVGVGHRATSIGVRRSTASSRIPGEGSSDSSIPRRSTTDSHRRPSAFT